MILPIYLYGSPVLRQTTGEIDPATYPNLKQLIADMFETMENADGVGLAAPQIGLPIRLFCIDLSPLEEDLPAGTLLRQTFINPVIYERSDEEVRSEEGCLSLPGIHEEVSRPVRIRIRYLDADLNPRDEEFADYMARVIQHEYDHIETKVFTDHISPLRRTLLRSKLGALAKGNYSARYRCKVGK